MRRQLEDVPRETEGLHLLGQLDSHLAAPLPRALAVLARLLLAAVHLLLVREARQILWRLALLLGQFLRSGGFIPAYEEGTWGQGIQAGEACPLGQTTQIIPTPSITSLSDSPR